MRVLHHSEAGQSIYQMLLSKSAQFEPMSSFIEWNLALMNLTLALVRQICNLVQDPFHQPSQRMIGLTCHDIPDRKNSGLLARDGHCHRGAVDLRVGESAMGLGSRVGRSAY